MASRRGVTPAEWDIMEAIWRLGRSASVRNVLDEAFPNGEKAYTTVQTTMNTLVRKKMLRRRKIGLVNFYTPTRRRDRIVNAEMARVISLVFGGSIPAVASSLLSLEELSIEQLEEIKALLAKKERELRSES